MKIIDTRDEEFKKLIDNVDFFGEGLEDCYIIEPDVFKDQRGYFSPRLIVPLLEKNIPNKVFEGLIQENESGSQKGTIRGLHYQLDPKCQTKVVSVKSGEAIDVIVDIRKDSPTFKKWFAIRLKPTAAQVSTAMSVPTTAPSPAATAVTAATARITAITVVTAATAVPA